MALRNFSSVSQYDAELMVVPVGINSMRRTPFLTQKTIAIVFLANYATLNFLFLGENE